MGGCESGVYPRALNPLSSMHAAFEALACVLARATTVRERESCRRLAVACLVSLSLSLRLGRECGGGDVGQRARARCHILG